MVPEHCQDGPGQKKNGGAEPPAFSSIRGYRSDRNFIAPHFSQRRAILPRPFCPTY